MSQFEKLSEAGRKIVDHYISDKSNILLSPKKKMELMVSLYAMMDGINPEVLNILGDSLKNLNESFSKEEIEILHAEYPAVMKYCFEKRDPYNEAVYYVDSKGYTNKMLPKSLLKLCLEIASPDKGDDVFLPYAGFSQIALSVPEANYFGFEQNSERWALSQMMLHASGVSSSITLTDDMDKSMPEGKQYNFIFCMPPFANGNEKKCVANNINVLATNYLAKNGIMCCILPMIFCFAKSGWFNVRKILRVFHNQYSAIVITLPQLPKVFNGTKLCLLYLIKDGKGDIELMDASKNAAFTIMHTPEYYEDWDINVESIIAILKHGSIDFCWFGKVEDLGKDLNLTPSRYILQETSISEEEIKYDLGDVIEIVPTEPIVAKEEAMYPIIGMKELSDNYLNCDIPFNNVPKKKVKNTQILTENCLLVGILGDTIKVGKIVDLSSEQFIALSSYVLPIRLKSNIINEEFLLRSFLFDNDLIEELLILSIGSAFTHKKQDFLEIQIEVPSLQVQNRLNMADSKNSISEAELKLKNAYEEFREDMHMKMHAIGQTIFNFNNWWKILLRARKEGNGLVDDNAVIGRSQKVSVKEIYDNLQQIIEHLQLQVSKFDRGNGLVAENISLTTFIEDYIAKHKSPIFRFVYDADSHYHIMSYGGEEVYDENGDVVAIKNVKESEVTFEQAIFAPEALTIIFDNIVSNACCHGFIGREEKPDDNIIRIKLYTEGADHIIEISNNGKPVSNVVTDGFVFTYNKSTQNGKSHFGIGGYEVKRLMQEFEGDAEFISKPEDRFPVVYKLIFHNTNIIEFQN